MNTRFAFAELKRTLGMLADRFPVRLQWENGQSLGDFLKATDALLTKKILHHQACSGRKWMKEASPDIDLDLTPIMNLNYSRKATAPSFRGVQTEVFPLPSFGEPPKVQSMAGLMDHIGDDLHTSFLYPSCYFDADTAAGMTITSPMCCEKLPKVWTFPSPICEIYYRNQ